MFPLKDENPIYSTPVLTVALIVICSVVFMLQAGAGAEGGRMIIFKFGLIPSVLLGERHLPPDLEMAIPALSLFTSMFLHGGWMHLIGNMWFLWIFGNNIEDVLGHGRFIVFYILAGLGAAAAQVLSDPGSNIPMVGASGAISGILGAYILLFPNARILTFVWLGFFITTMRIRAVWFLGIWFAMQAFNAAASSGGSGGGVAWWAHIGGFIAGIALLFILKPRRKAVTPRRKGPWG